MLTRQELSDFVVRCIDRGWMVRTLKPRSPRSLKPWRNKKIAW